ncbi:MAG: ADP-ribosylglycohydrolase family protein [Peptococcaceae bacterium]|nr:ADP-ribosylglycohydrolase family protein [Peptococcaceae bacterium]
MAKGKVKQETIAERAIACLWGGAVGDAMGKITEGYSPARIMETYGHKINRFIEPIQPLSQFSWGRAEVTEDSRQTVAIAQAVLSVGEVDQLAVARYLLNCDTKGIGTSSRSFHFILTKDIGHVALKGSGTGAATRVAPIGIINKAAALAKIAADVAKASAMTHGGTTAVAGAAAIAAAYAAAIEGWPAGYVMLQALKAAKEAEQFGYPDGLTSVAEKIQISINLAMEYSGKDLWDRVYEQIGCGFSANEAVPTAIILACTLLNAKEAILHAVNQGGDADAVAGMAGALAAALNPSTLPQNWLDEVRQANDLNLDQLAEQLIGLRQDQQHIVRGHQAEIGG